MDILCTFSAVFSITFYLFFAYWFFVLNKAKGMVRAFIISSIWPIAILYEVYYDRVGN